MSQIKVDELVTTLKIQNDQKNNANLKSFKNNIEKIKDEAKLATKEMNLMSKSASKSLSKASLFKSIGGVGKGGGAFFKSFGHKFSALGNIGAFGRGSAMLLRSGSLLGGLGTGAKVIGGTAAAIAGVLMSTVKRANFMEKIKDDAEKYSITFSQMKKLSGIFKDNKIEIDDARKSVKAYLKETGQSTDNIKKGILQLSSAFSRMNAKEREFYAEKYGLDEDFVRVLGKNAKDIKSALNTSEIVDLKPVSELRNAVGALSKEWSNFYNTVSNSKAVDAAINGITKGVTYLIASIEDLLRGLVGKNSYTKAFFNFFKTPDIDLKKGMMKFPKPTGDVIPMPSRESNKLVENVKPYKSLTQDDVFLKLRDKYEKEQTDLEKKTGKRDFSSEEVAQMAWKASSNTVNNYNITINGENKGATDIVDELQYRTKISEAGVQ